MTCSIPSQEGKVEAKVTSTQVAGRVRIHARAEGLLPAEAVLDTVRGKFRLQASPPGEDQTRLRRVVVEVPGEYLRNH